MPVTVVVGGQFGSEGKGKVAHYLAKEMAARAAIRVGGPNSGHTVIGPEGQTIIFRQLPTAAIIPGVLCVLPAGSYIDKDVLFRELRLAALNPDRLLIDPNAVVLGNAEKGEEEARLLGQRIGSTLTGTGAAVSRRVNRLGDVCLAHEDPQLSCYVRPVVSELRNLLEMGARIVIEGTQGYGLSVLHSAYYPFTTSRDTTAASFVSETGLSPRDVDDVVLVIRAFPIRVSGNSGPLPNEIDWESVTKAADSKIAIAEYTSVTQRLRRVARFDSVVVRQAIASNNPSRVVLNHMDYVDQQAVIGEALSAKASAFLDCVQTGIGRRVDYIGLSPSALRLNHSTTTQSSVG